MLGLSLATTCLILLALIGREIFYAANPSKRPLKRRRRR